MSTQACSASPQSSRLLGLRTLLYRAIEAQDPQTYLTEVRVQLLQNPAGDRSQSYSS